MKILMKMMLIGIGKITKQTLKMIQMEWTRVDIRSTYINKCIIIEKSLPCSNIILIVRVPQILGDITKQDAKGRIILSQKSQFNFYVVVICNIMKKANFRS